MTPAATPYRRERDGFHLRIDDLSSDPTRELLALHLVRMTADSPPGSVYALDLSGLRRPDVTAWTAWSGTAIAAIGALRILPDGNGEVKSMRTHPDFLRRGAAAQILRTMIEAARARGARRLSLETGSGPAFEPALALYRRHAFEHGEPFGDYEKTTFNRFLHLELEPQLAIGPGLDTVTETNLGCPPCPTSLGPVAIRRRR